MSLISAKIILDTTFEGHRITTFEVNLPRCIWPEVLTHRVFSRNSKSSRAVPVSRMIEEIESGYYYTPPFWGSNQKGMKAGEEIEDKESASNAWIAAKNDAVTAAKNLNALGLHKQVVNRVLEPFLMHKALITSTEYENFLYLRDDEEAEPNIRILAKIMKELLDNNTPVENEYHLPFTDDINDEDYNIMQKALISAGRCARISYDTHDGNKDPIHQINLAHQLMTFRHMSPFEHQARGGAKAPTYLTGNFSGFFQFRKFFYSENITRRVDKRKENIPNGFDESFFS